MNYIAAISAGAGRLLYSYLPQLLQGAALSLGIALGALTIGFIGGTGIALGLSSGNRVVRTLLHIYTTVIRGTPMLVQIVFLYYILSHLLYLNAVVCAIIAIGLNSSAYVSHIIKAGMAGISAGQLDAARSLGINRWQFTKTVVLPQAFARVLPALLNESITLVKDTSLASLIGVTELYQQGRNIIAFTYDSLTVYCGLALMYLAMTMTLSYIAYCVESYLHHRHATYN